MPRALRRAGAADGLRWLREPTFLLVAALVACCSCQPALADHVPGLPGPYPGFRVPTATGLTVDFSTEAELIAAISNDTVKVARLVKNLRIEAKGWPLLPIVRNTSFTIIGTTVPWKYPILVSRQRSGATFSGRCCYLVELMAAAEGVDEARCAYATTASVCDLPYGSRLGVTILAAGVTIRLRGVTSLVAAAARLGVQIRWFFLRSRRPPAPDTQDLAFIESKVQLEKDVVFTFKQVSTCGSKTRGFGCVNAENGGWANFAAAAAPKMMLAG
jgi:hypothetical protein